MNLVDSYRAAIAEAKKPVLDPQRLAADGRCVNCGRIAWDCPSCGSPCCDCKTPWAGGHRQHYHRDGFPYRLNLRSANARAQELYQSYIKGEISIERYDVLRAATA